MDSVFCSKIQHAFILFHQRHFMSFFDIYGNANILLVAVEKYLSYIKNFASCRGLTIIDKLLAKIWDSWKHPSFESSKYKNSKKLLIMVAELIIFDQKPSFKRLTSTRMRFKMLYLLHNANSLINSNKLP